MTNLHVDELATRAIGPSSAEAKEAKVALQTTLDLDDLNLEYFLALYRAFKEAKGTEALVLFEPGKEPPGKQTAYSTAVASPEMMKQLPYVDYVGLVSKGYASRAREASLWLKKMQAGSGTSVTRTTYLARLRGIPEREVKIGAKGTDLYAEMPRPNGSATISLAEMQILQSIHDAGESVFGEVVLQDIVSSETEEALEEIWNKKSWWDRDKTYLELAESARGFRKFGRSFQRFIPTIDEKKRASLNRMAPGGHALFAVDALRAAFLENRRPTHFEGNVLVATIGNGEDLSSTPDAAMVGWMTAERIPIAMVTTEKTENDLKGGQIALVQKPDGSFYATIVEQAQAKEAGQLKLFEELGLRPGDNMAFFNTNMALFNYGVLVPTMTKLVREIGETEFMRIIAPDLIENRKSQKDPDGQMRTYIQLEGAMGSSLLRLDRYWRERYGTPLVHFINVDRKNRTKFFSPIKTAFDYFMQFHSDRFSIDATQMRLVNRRPGFLPAMTLCDAASGDKYYTDVENVLHAFKGTKIRDLDALEISGRVILSGLVLRGKVKIKNTGTGEVNIAKFLLASEAATRYDREGDLIVLENTELSVS